MGFEAVNRLIIALDKSPMRGDVLIDNQIEERGQEWFMGELLHFGSDAVLLYIETGCSPDPFVQE